MMMIFRWVKIADLRKVDCWPGQGELKKHHLFSQSVLIGSFGIFFDFCALKEMMTGKWG
jgi:hypothetical protein